MNDFIFYFVSLSDGDASIRIRYIYSQTVASPDALIRDSSNSPFKDYASFYSFFCVISGKGTVNGESISEGYAFFDAPYLENDVSFEKGSILMNIAFDGVHSKKLLSDLKIDVRATEGKIIKINDFEKLIGIYEDLKNIYPADSNILTPEILSQISAKAFFYRAISLLEDESADHLSTHHREILVWAEGYMRNNFSNKVTIDDTARFLSIDRKYLYKLFKKYSGVSPKQYLNNIRISHAIELLHDKDMSISDIAYSVGYTDVLQFSSFFKKQTGLSPKNYRIEINKNNEVE